MHRTSVVEYSLNPVSDFMSFSATRSSESFTCPQVVHPSPMSAARHHRPANAQPQLPPCLLVPRNHIAPRAWLWAVAFLYQCPSTRPCAQSISFAVSQLSVPSAHHVSYTSPERPHDKRTPDTPLRSSALCTTPHHRGCHGRYSTFHPPSL